MKTSKRLISLALSLLLALGAMPALAVETNAFGSIGADPSTFPEVFDLRDVNGVSYVTPVKLQDPFATCWGFAAIASAETSILTSGLAAEMGYTADTLDLSEKHLAYFVTRPVTDEDDPQYGEGMLYRSNGTEEDGDPVVAALNLGGMTLYATNLFAAGAGPVLEDANGQFLYHGKNGTIEQIKFADGTTLDYCYSADDDWSINDDLRWKQNFVLKESYIIDIADYDGEETEADWLETVNGIKDLVYSGHAVEIGFCADTSMPGQKATTQYINENWAHFTYEDVEANHAVAIVGWDDHYPKENFKHKTEAWVESDDGNARTRTTVDAPIPEHDGAWLVKNSWGSGEEEFPNSGGNSWGLLQGQDKGVYNEKTGKYEYNAVEDAVHTGYFWLSYEDHSIDGAEALDFDLVTAMEGYYIAEYDYMPVHWIVVEQHSDMVKMANLFTVDEGIPSATLDSVSCQTGSANVRVTYDVYLLDGDDAVPTDGTRVSGATVQYRYGGFHKERLDTPVTLRGGDRFAVVVTQETAEDGQPCYSFNIQANVSAYGAEKYEYPAYAVGVVNPGESMFLLDGEWIDLTNPLARSALLKDSLDPARQDGTLDNFPIKAYLAAADTGTVAGLADVPKDAWYAPAVRWAMERGVAKSGGDGRFAPDATCTRAQMVEFLWRAAGKPEPAATEMPFADVDANASCRKAVLWAVENGVAEGRSSDRFAPEETVDRAQMAAFLYRYEQANGGGYNGTWTPLTGFSDIADVPDWAREPLGWLIENRVIYGIDGKLMPGGGCTRGQAITMLHRYFEL